MALKTKFPPNLCPSIVKSTHANVTPILLSLYATSVDAMQECRTFSGRCRGNETTRVVLQVILSVTHLGISRRIRMYFGFFGNNF